MVEFFLGVVPERVEETRGTVIKGLFDGHVFILLQTYDPHLMIP